jgi:predicted MFS family arabinose efflux permease
MLGRVMSLFALVLLGGTSGGAPIASSLSGSLGPRAPFFAGTAAAISALAIAAVSVSGRRRTDKEERVNQIAPLERRNQP